MKTRIAIIIVVIVAVLAALWWWRRDSASSTPHPTAAGAGSATGSSALSIAQQAQAFPADRKLPAWFVRTNAKTRRIAGRVTLDGKPAVATVVMQSMLTLAGFGKAIEVRTGPDGKFDLGEWPGGRYSIAAMAPDSQAATKQLDLADPSLATETLELRLRPCVSRVLGTVTDAGGAPIVEAQVRREGFVVAKTDAVGAYRTCVSYGEVELDYSADGYGAVTIGLTIFGSVTQDVVLVPSASITGHVVRASDGSPVADAHVSVFPAQWGRERPSGRSALTDASGVFRIDGLTPARYRAWAFAAGLASEAGPEVRAEVGVVNEVTIQLFDRASIAGVVTRADKALPGVMVTPVRKAPTGRGAPAWSQPDGTFVLDDVPIGDLAFSVEGYEVTAPATFKTEAARRYDGVKIQVAQLARIHGTVTRNGIPVEGAAIFGSMEAVTTDASGHYEITGLPPGTYQIGAGSDEAGAFTLPKKVTVAAGEEKRVDFELELAAEIAGTVVDAKGQPVPDVFVVWIHETTQDVGRGSTDAQGRYRCRAMSGGGVYTAKVFPHAGTQKPFPPAPGTTYPSREVKDGTTKIEGVTIAIDMQQLPITGRVIDSTGAPVADAVVKAMPFEATTEPMFNTWMKLTSTATDADGGFKLTNLLPGTYALQARSTDGAEQSVTGIAAGAAGVTIKLERPASIEGTLAGFTQPPVIYATPWNKENQLNPGTVTGNHFTISGVKPGRYVVNAQNMYEGDAKTIDVRAGEKAAVTLSAKGRGVIVGSVLDFKTKKPIGGAICRAVMSVDGQQGLTNWDETTAPKSDESGRVLVDPAPAGNVTLTCMVRDGRRSQPADDVVVPPGGRAEATLLSVEITVENPATAGAQFHWQVTPPRIASIIPKSGAAKAGLLAGDLIVAVDGQSVEGLNGVGVQFLLDDHTLGSTVNVTYQRGTVRKTVPVQITQLDL